VQRALVFLAVVGAVVTMGCDDLRREASRLRAEFSEAMSAPSADPDAIKRVEATTELGPGGVDFASVSCPAGYRIVYGSYHSVSPDNAEIFFSGTFGSGRTWAVGLDNSANLHTENLGSVTTMATCTPTDHAPSARAERAARKRVKAAVTRHAPGLSVYGR
jgi:hypothetical protein